MFPMLIDVVVLLLLVGTIGYAWLLDRRIRKLMAALRELRPMVSEYSQAVDRSERSLQVLKSEHTRSAPQVRSEPSGTRSARRADVPDEARRRPPAKSDLVRNFFEMTRDKEHDQ